MSSRFWRPEVSDQSVSTSEACRCSGMADTASWGGRSVPCKAIWGMVSWKSHGWPVWLSVLDPRGLAFELFYGPFCWWNTHNVMSLIRMLLKKALSKDILLRSELPSLPVNFSSSSRWIKGVFLKGQDSVKKQSHSLNTLKICLGPKARLYLDVHTQRCVCVCVGHGQPTWKSRSPNFTISLVQVLLLRVLYVNKLTYSEELIRKMR